MGVLLLVVHIFVCAVLIMVVLLQSGKAADLAGAFGGGGSQTALGSRGAATFMTKATTTAAILFMLTSLGLALHGSRGRGSVLETVPDAAAAGAAEPAVKSETGAELPAIEEEVPAEQAAAPGAETQDLSKDGGDTASSEDKPDDH
jgi:preprotein translocase subunit SecG